MRDPVRVKVSFTIELEEVPQVMMATLTDAASRLDSAASAVKNASSAAVSGDKVDLDLLQSIDLVRRELMGIDLKLQDCQMILGDYMTAQLQLATDDGDHPPEE
jgi:hypothetical protein